MKKIDPLSSTIKKFIGLLEHPRYSKRFAENTVPLAIFDLDNTLIAGDSDHLWGEYLAEQGWVDAQVYRRANDRFYAAYQNGQLDIHEFLAFSLEPLSAAPMSVLHQRHAGFMRDKILPILLPKAQALIQKHQQQGDTLLIITATNEFVTAPIAKALGIDHLLATIPEIKQGRYTGKVAGTPCFQAGKVERLNDWLQQQQQSLTDSCFYTDSHNDLPLLRQVTYPVAVDPDERLTAIAQEHDWPILSLR